MLNLLCHFLARLFFGTPLFRINVIFADRSLGWRWQKKSLGGVPCIVLTRPGLGAHKGWIIPLRPRSSRRDYLDVERN